MQDNEIDFVGLLKVLWKQKIECLTIIILTVFIGGFFLLFEEPKYEAKMQYSMNTKPPFYNDEKPFMDFHNSFYSEKLFNNWKIENNTSSINFEDFSNLKNINGFKISSNENNQIAALSFTVNPHSRYIYVKSNDISIIKDFFLYSSFISEMQKNKYLSRAKDEIKIFKKKFKISSTSNTADPRYYLSLDRFIVDIEAGGKVIAVNYPTSPELKSLTQSSKILFLSLLGFIFSIFFIIIRNYVIMQKKKF